MNQQDSPAGLRAWVGQALLYGAFALTIAVFSNWPVYRPLPAGQALVKLSFTHAAKRMAECRKLSAEELARLPPNMRSATKCERERAPVKVEVDIDGAPVFRELAPPSGLSRDGASSIYRRAGVTAGTHRIAVRMKDSPGSGDFDYRREAEVNLKPAQILVIDFDAEKGGITLQ